MHNDDAHNYETAQRVLDGEFLWAEAGIIDTSGEGPMVGLPDKSTTNVHRGGLQVAEVWGKVLMPAALVLLRCAVRELPSLEEVRHQLRQRG